MENVVYHNRKKNKDLKQEELHTLEALFLPSPGGG
jgi:hypothetical protein